MFLVEGQPTYVMALTDSTGILRGYGLVNVKNYQVAVEASTLAEAARKYANQLNTSGASVDQSVKPLQAQGIILRIHNSVQSGNSVYYLVVSGIAPVLTGSANISELLPILQDGDKVTVKHAQGVAGTSAIQDIHLDSPLQPAP